MGNSFDLVKNKGNRLKKISTLAQDNPLVRVCCFVDSDLNFSIFHNDSMSPTNKHITWIKKSIHCPKRPIHMPKPNRTAILLNQKVFSCIHFLKQEFFEKK